MITTLLVASLLSQSYVRSRVDAGDTSSQCLWWLENTTVVYHQASGGNPETPGDTEFTAVAKAFATWQVQLAACGSLTLQEGARTSSRSVGYDTSANATNEDIVLFRQKACTAVASATDACWKNDDCGNVYDCWQFSTTAIAITTTSYDSTTGRIFDADIELNTPSFIFTTVDAPACLVGNYSQACVATDVQNTLTHEVGHLLGLAHDPSATSIMYAKADPGETSKRVLDQGSKQFICDVYPKGKPSLQCLTPVASDTIGKAAGCTAAPDLGALGLAGLALVGLRRRSRRR